MSKVVEVQLECPLCTLEGRATVVLAYVPGVRSIGVDDVGPIEMSCTCLQSAFVKQDDLRAHLRERAEQGALDRAA